MFIIFFYFLKIQRLTLGPCAHRSSLFKLTFFFLFVKGCERAFVLVMYVFFLCVQSQREPSGNIFLLSSLLPVPLPSCLLLGCGDAWLQGSTRGLHPFTLHAPLYSHIHCNLIKRKTMPGRLLELLSLKAAGSNALVRNLGTKSCNEHLGSR